MRAKIVAVVLLAVAGVLVAPAPAPGATATPTIAVYPNPASLIHLPSNFIVQPNGFNTADSQWAVTLNGVPQLYTQPNGNSSVNFTASPPCGTSTVALYGWPTPIHVIHGSSPSYVPPGNSDSASEQITVICPEFTLTPSTIDQPSEPTTIQLQGDGWHSSAPVNVEVDGKVVQTGTTGYSDVGSASVQLSFTAQGLGCGPHQVLLAEQTTSFYSNPVSATGQLTVQNCPVPPANTPAALTLNPTVLQPGQLTNATGTGFAPNQPVTLVWEALNGTPLLGSTTVTASAQGTIQAYCLVFDNDQTGPRQLVAQQNGTNAAVATALVDQGSLQPVSGGQLVYRR
jgi:hypothetical protein